MNDISDKLDPLFRHIDQNIDRSLERLFALMRIPTISTDLAYAGEVRRGADHMVGLFEDLGFEASARDTDGHPMVIAHQAGPTKAAPHLLYYGHYDVQPADPPELWDTAPFEPVLIDAERGKRIVGRGAVDDKGQLMTFVEAFRAWKTVHGELPCAITVMLEGEEETGSPSLKSFLENNARELAADVCIASDTGMWSIDQPAITYGLRGMVYVEVSITGPNRDLHSGRYGGSASNPLNTLCRIVGSLHDHDGRIAIPGFYDDVLRVEDSEKRQWDGLEFDEAAFLDDVGLIQHAGESGYNALERIWARPTCDINGMWGGYTGEGHKTIIPSRASAKISCRLVPDQDPQKIFSSLKAFITDQLPPDFTIEITELGCSRAVRVPTNSEYLQAAKDGLRDEYGCEPVLIGSGGSIPAIGSIRTRLGIDSILVGFGLTDDRVHSPNEKFELACFHRGIRAHAAILGRMAGL